jgi:hypothetical protein
MNPRSGVTDRSGDVCDRAKQDHRIVLRPNEAAPLPKGGGFDIDGVDEQRSPTDQACSEHAALQGVFQQARPHSSANPTPIRRQLSQKQARYGGGRLSGTDGSRQGGRQDGGWCEAVIADHATGFMNDKHGRESLFLIVERARLQPTIKRWLAAGKFGNVMCGRQRFGAGDRQAINSRFLRRPIPTAPYVRGSRPFRVPKLQALIVRSRTP